VSNVEEEDQVSKMDIYQSEGVALVGNSNENNNIHSDSSSNSVDSSSLGNVSISGSTSVSSGGLDSRGSSPEIKCLYTNARSLLSKNKIDELTLRCLDEDIDIVGVTETWLHADISDSEINIPGYEVFRRDRKGRGSARGGGVLLYVRDSFNAAKIEEEPADNSSDSESLWVTILEGKSTIPGNKSKKTKTCLHVGISYRAPNCSREVEKCLLENVELYSDKSMLLMGDYNYPGIDWELMQTTNNREQLFLNAINDSLLTQHSVKATRGSNILDLILTSEPSMINEIKVGCPISNSDHNVLTWNISLCTCIDKTNVINHNFHKADYTKINEELYAVDWDVELADKSVNGMWDRIKEIVLDCRDRHVPIRKAQTSDSPVWMRNSIRKGITNRGKKWKRFQFRKTYCNEAKYKNVRNKVTNKIRQAKRGYENNLASRIKSDPKSFYAYVRSKTKTKSKVGPLKNDQGVLTSDSSEMCELLNHYFATVFTKEDISNMPTASNKARGSSTEILDSIDIDEAKILEAVSNLQDNKAAGVDEINSTFLKGIIGALLKPLKLLFIMTLDTGEIPKDWKDANVAVIF
jgi:Endonuclease-reverse transcriptase